MKKQIVIASAALILGAFACKKNETTPPPPLQNQGLETNQAVNVVNQKMFTLSEEQTTEYIKNLRGKVAVNSKQQRALQNNITTTKDTAIWEIEALLNYDFDAAQNPLQSSSDSLTYSLAINTSSSIDYSEITNAYIALSTQIKQHLNANTTDRVKLIDVTATENNNLLQLVVYVIYTTNNASQRTTTSPCDAITISGHYAGAPGTTGVQCSSESNHGPQMCNTRLNCSPYTCSSGYNLSYTNVSSVTLGVNGMSNPYFFASPYMGDCYGTYLSASQLNSNVSTAQANGVTYKPTLSSIIVSNYNFYCTLGLTNGGMPWNAFWKLTISYGTPLCTADPFE